MQTQSEMLAIVVTEDDKIEENLRSRMQHMDALDAAENQLPKNKKDKKWRYRKYVRKQIRENCKIALKYFADMLTHLKSGNALDAARAGYWLGRYQERVVVLVNEPLVKIGKAQRQSALKASKSKQFLPQIDAAELKEQEKQICEMNAKSPDLSARGICANVAKKHLTRDANGFNTKVRKNWSAEALRKRHAPLLKKLIQK